MVVLYCVDVVLGRGQWQSHIEKPSLVTYHHYSLFQVSAVSPKLPLYSLQPFSISLLLCCIFVVTENMMLTRCSLITTAVNSARTIACCVQHKNMDKQSYSCKNNAYKETNFEIDRGQRNNVRLYSTMGNETVLPKQAQIVICGAGTVANSVAYHLVQNGWNDILVLEQKV